MWKLTGGWRKWHNAELHTVLRLVWGW